MYLSIYLSINICAYIHNIYLSIYLYIKKLTRHACADEGGAPPAPGASLGRAHTRVGGWLQGYFTHARVSCERRCTVPDR